MRCPESRTQGTSDLALAQPVCSSQLIMKLTCRRGMPKDRNPQFRCLGICGFRTGLGP